MAYNYAAFFEDPIDSSIEPFHLPINEKLAFIREAVSRNRTLTEVLITGKHPKAGISDYDLVYFDSSDLSWEAEDSVIRTGHRIFKDLKAPVQIRNQARVHLW
ncbi:hypothetical protein AAEP93_005639 [Penicillium crustosum]